MKSKTLSIVSGDKITVDEAENFARLADPELLPSSISFDMSNCRHLDTSAGRILANLMRRLGKEGNLAAKIPGLEELQSPATALGRRFKLSLLGKAIAQYAEKISDGQREITDYYKRSFLNTPNVTDETSASVQDLHLPGNIRIDDEGAFISDFFSILQSLHSDTVTAIRRLPRELIEDLGIVSREAIQNVYDHASRAPLPPGTTVISGFSIELLRGLKREGAYGPFVKQTTSRRSGPADFLEISISDNGSTIPARHSEDAGIHWKSVAQEWEVFTKALEKNESIKLRTLDSIVRRDVGQGYPKIIHSVRKLGGFARLRTGGVTASLNSFSRVQIGFQVEQSYRGRSFGFMPGTLLEVLIPLPTGSR